MPLLHLLLPTLTILIHLLTPTHTFTVPQSRQGGFQSPLTPHPLTSDWLQSTRCFCLSKRLFRTQTQISQWEYYNRHLNTTFLVATTVNTSDYANGGSICDTYQRNPYEEGKKIKMDMICIYPDDKSFDSHWKTQDTFEFNGQTRGLGLMEGQGYEDSGTGALVCPAICDEWISMDWVHGGANATVLKGYQVTYDDMDDMCDTCK